MTLLRLSPSHLLTFSPLFRFAPAIAVAVAIILPTRTAHADAIVVTKAMTATTVVEVFVEESLMRIEMEIGVADLLAFQNLLPDEIRAGMGLESHPYDQRLRSFTENDFVIRADDGPPLPGRVTHMEARRRVPRDELTGEPLPAGEDEGVPVIFVVLEYPFSGQPKILTLQPPTAGGDFPAATIGFITYHLGLPVMDFRYLGAVATLDLDWDDPWYSKFRNRNLWRQYDSPMNAFLYVEPYEVRVEIITRPKDIQQWVDLGLDGRGTIPVDIQEEIKARVAAFLADHLNLLVDGAPIAPQLDRVNFLNRTLRTSTVISPPQELDASSATLGVIWVHPTAEYPQEASITWDLFTPRIQRIPGAATDEAGPLRFFLQPDDNVLWWKNFLTNPTMPTLVDVEPPPSRLTRGLTGLSWCALLAVGVILVGEVRKASRGHGSWRRVAAPALVLFIAIGGAIAATRSSLVTDQRAEEIVTALLHNVYRAFDFREEEVIYDTLEQSVSGDLLTQTYLETRRGLELASQGGARAKVTDIEMLEVTAEPAAGRSFTARCTWNVAGSVGHWGHIHQRTNQYEAELTIAPLDGHWKITGLELVREERL